MVLNYIWVGFFLIAFVVGIIQLAFLGNKEIFSVMVESTFSMSKVGFEISLGLTGVLTLWLGIMKIGEKGGAVSILAVLIRPFFKRLFPEIPESHPANGSMMMNFAANMLGLDNAATPMGLKAIGQLQELNPNKDIASNAQIMFLVLNTSGLTLIPISVMVYRAQLGAVNPTDIFIPILLATYFSTLAGLLAVSLFQKINLLDPVILAYLGGMSLFIGAVLFLFSQMEQEQMKLVSQVVSNVLLFSVIVGFIGLAAYRRLNVYETFIEGAKDGFQIAIRIIPYLIAILVAIGVFRASGAMEFLIQGIKNLVIMVGLDTQFVDALPTAMMKPLSGSGARGMMVDTMKNLGPDAFASKLACTFQGATDTTFYVIAVYFGSISIRKTRYAITCGLIADLAGIIAAVFIGYLFFS